MNLEHQTLAVIGAGNIGRALIGGLLRKGAVPSDRIHATRRRASGLHELRQSFPGIQTGNDNRTAVEKSTVIILSIKPQNAVEVIAGIRDQVLPGALIVSVLAGLSSAAICRYFQRTLPVVRAMPNTPMIVQQGATALAAGASAERGHIQVVRRMFEAVGTVEEVPEPLIDAVTGLSGSGPAYVYMLIEALTDAGVKQGLQRKVAFRLSTQTVLGAAHLVARTRRHPAILRDEVTTPGGTAIAAIAELEAHGLRTMFINAVATATERSQELSKLFD